MESVEDAAARLRLIVREINRRGQDLTGEGSPTRSQQAVLARLHETGSSTVGALAGEERIRPQSMSELVDTVAHRGWVTRRRDDTDRRQVLVSLTAAGTEAVDRGRRLRQSWLAEAMHSRLDGAEQRQLVAAIGLLERVVLPESAGPTGTEESSCSGTAATDGSPFECSKPTVSTEVEAVVPRARGS